MTGLRVGSLFSGYGGLDAAVCQHYGATVVWHVEFDKHPSAVLATHYPDVPNYGDITTVDWSQVEPVDILTGGFPCQDVSHAGLRAGVRQGTRSGLWYEMARAIDQLQPKKVVIENVAGLLSADATCDVEPCPWCVGDEPGGHMRALGAVLADLAEMGFDAQWGGVRAADAGAPHGRLRIFIVASAAHPDSERGDGRWVSDGGVVGEHDEVDRGRRGVTAAGHDRAPADAARARGDRGGDAGPGRRPELADGGGDVDGLTLLPTPKASDGPNGGPGMRNGRGVADALPGVVTLLPTPTAQAAKHGSTPSPNGYRSNLFDVANIDFGPYTAAIARWEQVLGRPAPPPTEPGQNGRPRLSPRFVEFMQGLPDGWVCDVDIPRSAQLKCLGNGVVPAQALLALSLLDGAR